MICPFCNKYEATIHLTQITNGKKHEIHICEFCAKEKGLFATQLVDFSELLVGMASGLGNDPDAVKESAGTIQAGDEEAAAVLSPEKASAMAQFQKSGRFRSPEDYDLLHDQLVPLLEKIHGSARHIGKRPASYQAGASVREKLEYLRAVLRSAIKEEYYEKAAQVRDEIRDIEKQLPAHTGEAKED